MFPRLVLAVSVGSVLLLTGCSGNNAHKSSAIGGNLAAPAAASAASDLQATITAQNQQIADLQATVAALQKQAQTTPAAVVKTVVVTVTPPPTPSPSPTPSPTPVVAGTRDNPLPIGTAVDLGDGWQLKVLSVQPNATQAVLARNQFNARPPADHQFFIAQVQATYTGSGSAKFDGGFRLRTVGAGAVSYSTFDDSCGVIPNELPDSETFTGGTIAGNLCWDIRSSDAGSLVLYDNPFLGGNQQRVYLSLVQQ
ncbi:MAG TPA: hypothetical protein VFD32_01940 [Dehalococcoidia bacterium]|nr:hypothetical protein [Dehalococcoidia bacterium]